MLKKLFAKLKSYLTGFRDDLRTADRAEGKWTEKSGTLNKAQLLARGYRQLDQAEELYKTEILPEKESDPSGFTEAEEWIGKAGEFKRKRNVENYARSLEETIREVRNVSDKDMLLGYMDTLDYYAGKLRRADKESKYSVLLLSTRLEQAVYELENIQDLEAAKAADRMVLEYSRRLIKLDPEERFKDQIISAYRRSWTRVQELESAV